jgi:hypothetical protein
MGKLWNGILGKVSGKVGNVVTAKWKDKNTVRAYAKPSNPRTALQTAQRDKFKFLVAAIKPAYLFLTMEIMRGFSKSISPINALMNYSLTKGDNGSNPPTPYIVLGKKPARATVGFTGTTKSNMVFGISNIDFDGRSMDEVTAMMVLVNATTGAVEKYEMDGSTWSSNDYESDVMEMYFDCKAGDVIVGYIYFYPDGTTNPKFEDCSMSFSARKVLA